MSSNSQEKPLTEEEKRAKRLEQLAKAREKAWEKKRAIGALNRQEKAMKEELMNERLKKLEMLKEAKSKNPDLDEDEEAEVQKAPKGGKNASTAKKGSKKVIKKVIEVSDSSSEDDSESSSDDEPQVEYVVRRTKKGSKAPAKPPKAPKNFEEYDTPQLSAEVAKSVLKKRVMDDAQSIAFRSLFPYHNFWQSAKAFKIKIAKNSKK